MFHWFRVLIRTFLTKGDWLKPAADHLRVNGTTDRYTGTFARYTGMPNLDRAGAGAAGAAAAAV